MRPSWIFAVAVVGGGRFGCATQGRSAPGEVTADASAAEETDCTATCGGNSVRADGTCATGCPSDYDIGCGGQDYQCCGECEPPAYCPFTACDDFGTFAVVTDGGCPLGFGCPSSTTRICDGEQYQGCADCPTLDGGGQLDGGGPLDGGGAADGGDE